MSWCGTRFKDDSGLDATDRETLLQLERLASRLEKQAYDIKCAVEYAKRNNTLKGLSDMVAYAFNANQFQPQYGGGAPGLPAGPNGENVKYKVMITSTVPVDTKDNFGNPKGGYLAFELACIEGPQQGVKHTDRLNLHHVKSDVVEIANKQLSAYCHVLGKFQFQNTEELHNIPFMVEIGLQKGDEAKQKGYTEVKSLYDINGNEPGKAGAGPQVNQQQPNIPSEPAGGVTVQGGGWNNNGGNNNNQQQPQQNNNNNNNNNGGGWGGPNQGQQPQQGQQGQQGQQPDPNQNGGQWSQNGGQNGGNQGGGWNNQGGGSEQPQQQNNGQNGGGWGNSGGNQTAGWGGPR